MPSFVNILSICRQKELNVFKGSTCCFRPMWKLTSYTMATKVSQTASWVLMHSLSWAQCKRWIPIGSMGCVHMHQRIPAIKGWGSPSHIWSIVEKIGEVNPKFGKIGWIVNQTFTPRLEHDRIWVWWASNILLENMLKKVRWCRRSKMESWNWIICCPMSCLNEKKHAWIKGGRRSHAALKCCWKGKVLLSTLLRLQEENDVDQP